MLGKRKPHPCTENMCISHRPFPLPYDLQAHVCVTSYDLVQKLDPDLVKRYGVVLVDESHCLKTRDTKRTQVRGQRESPLDDPIFKIWPVWTVCSLSHCKPLCSLLRPPAPQFLSKLVKAARHAVLMTGTPLLSKPIEVYPQVWMQQIYDTTHCPIK